MRVLLAFAAVVVLAPGIAVAGAGTGGDTDDDVQIVDEAKQAESAFVIAYNDRNWDAFRSVLAEDVLVLAPNAEPINGRDAAVEYFKSARDAFGEINDGHEHLSVNGSGNLARLAGVLTAGPGRVRVWYSDLYELQPDGSVLFRVKAFGFPQRAAG
ncbi:MAG TPA: nuclear transport factor 2 family protein [Acidimicrobiia bacterium]|nr:nuclear transport factor 2 family protein [Acidimicrobiia bacterium]